MSAPEAAPSPNANGKRSPSPAASAGGKKRSPRSGPKRTLSEVLPKAGLVYSEKGNLSEVLCKPKIMAIKSITLEKIEQMEKEAAMGANALAAQHQSTMGGIMDSMHTPQEPQRLSGTSHGRPGTSSGRPTTSSGGRPGTSKGTSVAGESDTKPKKKKQQAEVMTF